MLYLYVGHYVVLWPLWPAGARYALSAPEA
jgi:hypothetical protein